MVGPAYVGKWDDESSGKSSYDSNSDSEEGLLKNFTNIVAKKDKKRQRKEEKDLEDYPSRNVYYSQKPEKYKSRDEYYEKVYQGRSGNASNQSKQQWYPPRAQANNNKRHNNQRSSSNKSSYGNGYGGVYHGGNNNYKRRRY